jgi:hypothetical protein
MLFYTISVSHLTRFYNYNYRRKCSNCVLLVSCSCVPTHHGRVRMSIRTVRNIPFYGLEKPGLWRPESNFARHGAELLKR